MFIFVFAFCLQVQITAEQILREAAERQEKPTDRKPRQNITDPEELEEFK